MALICPTSIRRAARSVLRLYYKKCAVGNFGRLLCGAGLSSGGVAQRGVASGPLARLHAPPRHDQRPAFTLELFAANHKKEQDFTAIREPFPDLREKVENNIENERN